jgi:hypothetical protein
LAEEVDVFKKFNESWADASAVIEKWQDRM